MTQLSVLGQKAVEAKSGQLPSTQLSNSSPSPITPTQLAPPMSLSLPSNTHTTVSPNKVIHTRGKAGSMYEWSDFILLPPPW